MVTNILDYLENSAARVPDKIVFAEEHKSVTFAELVDYGKRIGTTILEASQNASRQPIVVYVERNIESLISFIGVVYSGNFYVPIDKQMPKARIELILQTLQPIATIVQEIDLEFSKSVAPNLKTITYESTISNEDIDEELLRKIRRCSLDTDPVYATFTSGSTGIPKGVITSFRSVIDMTEALTTTFGFNEEIIVGNQNPFYFDASIKDIYCTLKCGGTMYIVPKTCFLFPGKLVDFLNKFKINLILWSAAAIAHVANTNAFDVNTPVSLKKVMFSGEVMHNKVLNYWRKALTGTLFVNLYGPTEITSVCSYYIVEEMFEDDEPLPIGVPFKNTEILILNENNQLVTEQEIGEICVRGCCLALGYYNNSEKTAEVFCQNPLNDKFPEIIYKTGDLARYNPSGQIMFLSRKDNQVKHMGQRIELGEIELVINSLDFIDSSVCFYDHDKQKIVLIFTGKNSDTKYIINSIKDKLPKYMFPNLMIYLREMPYNLNGKIDRTHLKGLYKNGHI